GTTGASGTFTADAGSFPAVATTAAGGNGNVIINAGSIVLNDDVTAGTGDATLTASTGSITGTGTLTGNNVSLSSVTGVGSGTSGRLNTTATTLAASSTGTGGVFINETDAVTLATIPAVSNSAGSGGYDVVAAGTINVNSPITSTGTTTLNSTGGGLSIT